MDGRAERELLLRELQRSLRQGARVLEPPAVDGDQRDRKQMLRELEPVLHGDVVRGRGTLGSELPPPGPPFDERQRPQRLRAPQLVARAPLVVRALEHRAGLVDPEAPRRTPASAATTSLHELAVGRRHELTRPSDARRGVGIAGHGAERGEHGERTNAQRVVVEPLSQGERGACMLGRARPPVPEARRPREPDVHERLEGGVGRRRLQRLLEQGGGTVRPLELREQQEALDPERAADRSRRRRSVASVRARVHSPAA